MDKNNEYIINIMIMKAKLNWLLDSFCLKQRTFRDAIKPLCNKYY